VHGVRVETLSLAGNQVGEGTGRRGRLNGGSSDQLRQG
jgi:hypothetical protein